MQTSQLSATALVLLLALLLLGRFRVQRLPDLVPVPGPGTGPGRFCRRRDGNLVVVVRNQGNATASASVTRVNFGAFGVADAITPALPPGNQVELEFPIPPGAFDPDLDFTITVDANNQVAESNELNNTVTGICIG